MSKAVLFSAPIVSGLLVVFALPSFDLGFLAWFGLAPLLFVLRQRGPLAAAGLGYVFGFIFGSGSFYWLNTIPFVTPSRFLLMGVVFSLYYLVFGLVYNLIGRKGGGWLIVGAPALWVSLEYARANLSSFALAWNFLGDSQYQYLPVIQIADITGVYGVSFLIVMVNQVLSQLPDFLATRGWMTFAPATLAHVRWRPHLFALVLALTATLFYGWYRLAEPEGRQHVRVAVIQTHPLALSSKSLKDQTEHLRAFARLTQEAAREKTHLIVWPSSSLPAPISSPVVRLFVGQLAYQTGAYLLVGGSSADKFATPEQGHLPYANSEFLISPSGRLEGQYNRVQLTPFTEYVPLHGMVKWPRWITTLEKGYVPGQAYTLFQVSGARFGALICWENSFPQLSRRFVLDGAHFMVSVTNERIFGHTSAPYQTLAMNVFRAVENRVAIARAATTGVSAFISSKGEIVQRVMDKDGNDLFVSGFLVRDVPLSVQRTFYTTHGDVFAHAAIGLAVFILPVSLLARRRAQLVRHDSSYSSQDSGYHRPTSPD